MPYFFNDDDDLEGLCAGALAEGHGVEALEDVVENIPGVGHVKGAVHYALGDNEKGNKAIMAANRGLLVGAGALAGPAGAIAAGAYYDELERDVERMNRSDGDKKLDPNWHMAAHYDGDIHEFQIKQGHIRQDVEINDVIEFVVGAGMDAFGGKKINNAAGNFQKGQHIKKALPDKISGSKKKDIVKDIVDLKKKMKAKQLTHRGHVMTKSVDKKGKVGTGLSSRARQDERVSIYYDEVKRGKNPKTYASKSQAKKSDRLLNGTEESPLLRQNPTATQKVGKRSLLTCAEHQAAANLEKAGGGKIHETISIQKRGGNEYVTVGRCENCQQFNMGEVHTDGNVADKVIPDRFVSGKGLMTKGAEVFAGQGAARMALMIMLMKKYNLKDHD